MKLAVIGALAIAVGGGCAARADGLQGAYAAVGGALQAQGGGLAPLYAACPKNSDKLWLYVSSALFVPISPTDSAVLVNAGDCGGGNGAWQYLVMNQRGAARVVNDAVIGDMSFVATSAYAFDGALTLYGNRWLPSDPHCCPSKKATLEFNLRTGTRKFTVLSDGN